MQGMVTQVMGRQEGQQGPMRQTQDYQQQRANNPSWKEKKEDAELQEARGHPPGRRWEARPLGTGATRVGDGSLG